METVDELIDGLQNALNLMHRVTELQERREQLRAQYQSHVAMKKTFGRVKLLVLTFLLWAVIQEMQIGGIYLYALVVYGLSLIFGEVPFILKLAYIVFLIPSYLIVKLVQKLWNRSVVRENQRRTATNEQIDQKNAALLQAENQIIEEIKALNTRYGREVAPWYPSDYCYEDAAAFFLNVLQNYRADSLKEAINLYETTLHQNRMEETQKKILQQQKLANILAVSNLVMQAGTQAAVDQNTQAVHQQTRAVNDMKNAKWTIRFK